MQKIFKHVFTIRAGEFILVQSFFLYYVSISMFITLGFSIGDSLFLTYVGQETVHMLYAWGYIGMAAMTMCVTWFYAKIMEFLSRIQLVLGTQLLFLLAVFAVRQLIPSNGVASAASNEWVYFGLVLVLKVCGQLLIVQFFSFAGDYFTAHNARRVYGYIAGGLATGSILGGMMVGPGVSLIGPTNMLYVCMGLLAIGIGFSLVIYLNATPIAFSDKKRPGEPLLKAPLRTVLARPYLRSILLITLIGAVCFVFIDFQMKVSAKHVYVNSADLATFLGRFYMYAGIMTAIVQFSLVGFFLRQFGIISCLMMLPWLQAVMSLLFYMSGDGFGAGSSLFIISSANFFRIILSESLDLPSRELLFLPLSSHVRVRVQAIIGGIIEPFGLGVGGLLLIGFSSLMTPLFQYSLLVFSFACIWLFLLMRLQPRYRHMLSASLKSTHLDDESLEELARKQCIEAVLRRMLHDEEKRVTLFALKLFHSRPYHDLPASIPRLTNDSCPEIAAKAIELLGRSGKLEYLATLENKLQSSSSLIRKAAILAICRIKKDHILPDMSRWLKAPDPIVGYAALIGCGRYGGPEGRHLIRPVLKKLASARQVGKRRLAASLLREIGDPVYAPLLERLLDDPDPTVRIAAVKACVPVQSPILISHLLRLYHSAELQVYIVEVLEQMPEEYAPAIANAAQNLSLGESSRNLLLQVLGSIGGQVAQRQLWDVFSGSTQLSVRVTAGNALWRLALRGPLQEISETDIDERLEELCRNIDELNHACAEISSRERVLQQFLYDQARLEIECLFQILSFRYDVRQIEKVQYNFFSSGQMQQANALELLDDILPRHLAPRIGELLDSFLQRKEFYASGLSLKSIQHLLRKELWLKAIIEYYHKGITADRLNGNGHKLFRQIEKIAFLKHVPLFQDVPANYLLPLAEVADTCCLRCGETLFLQGERGDALYLIRRGEIDVEVNGVLVNQMEAGECIGEMAILGDTRRTASCLARKESEVLKISERHFHAIVKSQVNVAFAVLRILTKRLRRQIESMLAKNGVQRHTCRPRPLQEFSFSSCPHQERCMEELDDREALYHLLKQIAMLKALPLFKNIPENDLGPVARMARGIVLEKGDTLFHQGEQGHVVYFLCQGAISVQANGIELSRLQAGACLGEMAILDGEPRSASCVALEASEVLSFSATDFEILVKNHTSVALALLKTLAGKLRRQTQHTLRQQEQEKGLVTRFSA